MLKADAIKYLEKLHPDEPVFILRSQDQLAPKAVCDWANRALSSGKVPVEKINGAIADEMAMENWQRVNPDKVKLPD